MNFLTSILAVFVVDAVCAAMKFNQEETFVILIATTVLYFLTQFVLEIIEKWYDVG
jgi:low affinity Fe/Cu permease